MSPEVPRSEEKEQGRFSGRQPCLSVLPTKIPDTEEEFLSIVADYYTFWMFDSFFSTSPLMMDIGLFPLLLL